MYSLMNLLGHAGFARRAFIRQLCPPNSLPAYRGRVEEGRLEDRTRWPVGLPVPVHV
jgi:hypothetical protein